MWTPRRIVLLATGYALILAGYLGYAISALGGVDGLPALPEHFRPSPDDPKEPTLPVVRGTVRRVEERLKQAFGADCPEAKWPIQLELNNKTLVVAAQDFKLESDGRVSLMPVAVAVYGKERGPGGHPEINTMRGEVAYLTFDRPITNPAEVGGRKVVGGEISGNIEITSNRRSADKGDDLLVHIGTGPLYYAEAKQLIWTHDTVHVQDLNSKPRPMEVWGKGMEVELVAEAGPGARPGPRKPGNDKITGVKRLLLQSNVDMTLYVDGSSGFPGGRRDGPPPGTPPGVVPPPAEKAKLTIKTSGKFQYEFLKDHDVALFEVPDADPRQAARAPQHVFVERFFAVLNGRRDVRDQLYCGKLELHFKKRDAKNAERKPNETAALVDRGTDVVFARAQGPQVTISSDVENLEATGNDLVYDAKAGTTILRGTPHMTALKDRTRIAARELQITEQKAADGKKNYQTVVALGPGRIDVLDDKQIDREKLVAQAFWTDKLTSAREGDFDLLVLTGAARFVDRENEQTLQAETLKVWTTSPDAPGTAKVVVATGTQNGGRRVQVLEALGNVATTSRELNIHDTSRLIVRFRDAPSEAQLPAAPTGTPGTAPRPEVKPAPLPPGILPGPSRSLTPPAPPPTTRQSLKPPEPGPPTPVVAPRLGIPNAPAAPRDPNEKPRPVHLSARNVEAWVVRAGPKNTLERVWTEGAVHVKQAPAKPDEKGLDILGDTLAMDCHAEGNILEVTGDLAQLRMDRLYILGPVVNIDQTRNMAWVNGMGAMQMESQSNFAGDKLDRAVPMIVQWRESMLFNGTHAEFVKGVQAEQENALLVCDVLQVFFDRNVELKQGTKADQPPRVKNLVCHNGVRVEERVAKGDKVLKYQRIETGHLRLEALEPEDDAPKAGGKTADGNEVHGSGPGTLRLFQVGGPDPLAGGLANPMSPAPANDKKKEPEPKLTFIQYSQRLYANSKLHKASFYGQVRVLNLPATDPLREVNLEDLLADLPREALYLGCDQLTVIDRGEKGRSQQEMLAKGRVTIKAREFWGRAETVTFNEAKDQVILDGGEDGEATLFKEVGRGAPPQKITGKKITYLRSTGDFKLDEGRGLFGQ